MARTDLLGRLADLSEDAIQRLSDAPGAERVIGALNTMRDRLDELQKRVRGLEELEQRLTALERKVDKPRQGKRCRVRHRQDDEHEELRHHERQEELTTRESTPPRMSVGGCQPASCSKTIGRPPPTRSPSRATPATPAAATITARSVCPLGNDESNAAIWNAPS